MEMWVTVTAEPTLKSFVIFSCLSRSVVARLFQARKLGRDNRAGFDVQEASNLYDSVVVDGR